MFGAGEVKSVPQHFVASETKYIVATPESIAATGKLNDRFPDRFLDGRAITSGFSTRQDKK